MGSSVHNNATILKTCPNFGDSVYVIESFPSRKYIINQFIFCAANCVLLFPTVLLNGVSILTILRSAQLKGKLCYFLILLQSTIDFAVGAISLPLYALARGSEILGFANCVLVYFCEKTFQVITGTSFLTLFQLTLERYMSIVHPVTHKVHLTKRKLLACTGLLTLFSFLFNFVKFPSEAIHSTSIIASVAIVLAFNTYAYMKIFRVARNAYSGYRIHDVSVAIKEAELEKKTCFKEVKLAKSCALVVFLSYLCYVPGLVCYSVYKNDLVNFRVTYSWSMLIIALNSSLNSIVFFWKRPLFRGEAVKILRSLFRV